MGNIYLYAGIAGLAGSFVLLIEVIAYLRKEWRKIQENLEKIYG